MADHAFLAGFKTHYGIDAADTESDAGLNSLFPKIVSKIEQRTGGLVLIKAGTDDTEYHDGNGRTGTIFARKFPINDVTSIHTSTAIPRAYGASELVDTDDYSWDAETAKIYLLGSTTTTSSFPAGQDTVQLVYRPGYEDVDAVPEDLVDAVYEWVRDSQLRNENNRQGIRSVNAADGTTSYVVGPIPDNVKDALEPWTMIELGSNR